MEQFIVTYWPIAVAVIAIVGGWYTFKNEIKNIKEDIRELKEDRNAFMQCISDINKSIGDIKADVAEVKGFLRGKDYHEQTK